MLSSVKHKCTSDLVVELPLKKRIKHVQSKQIDSSSYFPHQSAYNTPKSSTVFKPVSQDSGGPIRRAAVLSLNFVSEGELSEETANVLTQVVEIHQQILDERAERNSRNVIQSLKEKARLLIDWLRGVQQTVQIEDRAVAVQDQIETPQEEAKRLREFRKLFPDIKDIDFAYKMQSASSLVMSQGRLRASNILGFTDNPVLWLFKNVYYSVSDYDIKLETLYDSIGKSTEELSDAVNSVYESVTNWYSNLKFKEDVTASEMNAFHHDMLQLALVKENITDETAIRLSDHVFMHATNQIIHEQLDHPWNTGTSTLIKTLDYMPSTIESYIHGVRLVDNLPELSLAQIYLMSRPSALFIKWWKESQPDLRTSEVNVEALRNEYYKMFRPQMHMRERVEPTPVSYEQVEQGLSLWTGALSAISIYNRRAVWWRMLSRMGRSIYELTRNLARTRAQRARDVGDAAIEMAELGVRNRREMRAIGALPLGLEGQDVVNDVGDAIGDAAFGLALFNEVALRQALTGLQNSPVSIQLAGLMFVAAVGTYRWYAGEGRQPVRQPVRQPEQEIGTQSFLSFESLATNPNTYAAVTTMYLANQLIQTMVPEFSWQAIASETFRHIPELSSNIISAALVEGGTGIQRMRQFTTVSAIVTKLLPATAPAILDRVTRFIGTTIPYLLNGTDSLVLTKEVTKEQQEQMIKTWAKIKEPLQEEKIKLDKQIIKDAKNAYKRYIKQLKLNQTFVDETLLPLSQKTDMTRSLSSLVHHFTGYNMLTVNATTQQYNDDMKRLFRVYPMYAKRESNKLVIEYLTSYYNALSQAQQTEKFGTFVHAKFSDFVELPISARRLKDYNQAVLQLGMVSSGIEEQVYLMDMGKTISSWTDVWDEKKQMAVIQDVDAIQRTMKQMHEYKRKQVVAVSNKLLKERVISLQRAKSMIDDFDYFGWEGFYSNAEMAILREVTGTINRKLDTENPEDTTIRTAGWLESIQETARNVRNVLSKGLQTLLPFPFNIPTQTVGGEPIHFHHGTIYPGQTIEDDLSVVYPNPYENLPDDAEVPLWPWRYPDPYTGDTGADIDDTTDTGADTGADTGKDIDDTTDTGADTGKDIDDTTDTGADTGGTDSSGGGTVPFDPRTQYEPHKETPTADKPVDELPTKTDPFTGNKSQDGTQATAAMKDYGNTGTGGGGERHKYTPSKTPAPVNHYYGKTPTPDKVDPTDPDKSEGTRVDVPEKDHGLDEKLKEKLKDMPKEPTTKEPVDELANAFDPNVEPDYVPGRATDDRRYIPWWLPPWFFRFSPSKGQETYHKPIYPPSNATEEEINKYIKKHFKKYSHDFGDDINTWPDGAREEYEQYVRLVRPTGRSLYEVRMERLWNELSRLYGTDRAKWPKGLSDQFENYYKASREMQNEILKLNKLYGDYAAWPESVQKNFQKFAKQREGALGYNVVDTDLNPKFDGNNLSEVQNEEKVEDDDKVQDKTDEPKNKTDLRKRDSVNVTVKNKKANQHIVTSKTRQHVIVKRK